VDSIDLCRGVNMKFAEWMGGTIAIAGLAMTVQTANAQNCDYYRNSACVVDTVVISGTNYPPDYGAIDLWAVGTVPTGTQTTPPPPGKPAYAVKPGRNTRTTPECQREQNFQDRATIALSLGFLQGSRIMWDQTMSDPGLLAYGVGWEKYEYKYTIVDVSNPTIVYAQIVLHYEYNPNTGHYTSPPHFVSSSVRGCASRG
jgi:hypothetical protein